MAEIKILSHSDKETAALGASMASVLKRGDVVALMGQLGTGKTTFTKGLAKGLNVSLDHPVASPTFVLMHEYVGTITLYHIDAYRLKGAQEAIEAGLEEYLYMDSIAVVEWADRIQSLLPAEALKIKFEYQNTHSRKIQIEVPSDRLANFKDSLVKS